MQSRDAFDELLATLREVGDRFAGEEWGLTSPDDVAEGLRQQGVGATAAAVIGDSPAATLLDLGRPERGVLLAVGTRGRGGVKRLMLGSVADKLVRGANVPVLVVPPPRRGR